jgi:large subunit ribosomal protein L21
MTAIIISGGKQYKVAEGDVIYVDKLQEQDGADVSFDNVLAAFEGGEVMLGQSEASAVRVTGKLIKSGLRKKLIVYKMHPKKNYRRKQGHRQAYSKVQIEKIAAG